MMDGSLLTSATTLAATPFSYLDRGGTLPDMEISTWKCPETKDFRREILIQNLGVYLGFCIGLAASAARALQGGRSG